MQILKFLGKSLPGKYLVFSLYYNLVLVVKYRRNVFDNDMSDYAKDMFVRLSESYNITLVEWNHDIDHVHILFKAHPNTEMTKFINAYKSASSRLIKRDFPQVRKKLWKEMFWSRSFCLLTTGGSSIDVVKKYIENQGGK
ncbi:putative transposase [Bacillus sp. RC54]